jgi:hypothetical protein
MGQQTKKPVKKEQCELTRAFLFVVLFRDGSTIEKSRLRSVEGRASPCINLGISAKEGGGHDAVRKGGSTQRTGLVQGVGNGEL